MESNGSSSATIVDAKGIKEREGETGSKKEGDNLKEIVLSGIWIVVLGEHCIGILNYGDLSLGIISAKNRLDRLWRNDFMQNR